MDIFEAPQFAWNTACIPANYAADSEVGIHILICSTRCRFPEIDVFIFARLAPHEHKTAAADAAVVHSNNANA